MCLCALLSLCFFVGLLVSVCAHNLFIVVYAPFLFRSLNVCHSFRFRDVLEHLELHYILNWCGSGDNQHQKHITLVLKLPFNRVA